MVLTSNQRVCCNHLWPLRRHHCSGRCLSTRDVSMCALSFKCKQHVNQMEHTMALTSGGIPRSVGGFAAVSEISCLVVGECVVLSWMRTELIKITVLSKLSTIPIGAVHFLRSAYAASCKNSPSGTLKNPPGDFSTCGVGIPEGGCAPHS